MKPTSWSKGSGSICMVVDSEGNTLDFLLSAKRSRTGSRAVLRKTLNFSLRPTVMNVDKNAVYPPAVDSHNRWTTTTKRPNFGRWSIWTSSGEQDHRNICATDKTGNGILLLWVSFDLNRFAGRSISPRSIEVCKEILGKVYCQIVYQLNTTL